MPTPAKASPSPAGKPSGSTYVAMVGALLLFGLAMGYTAATQPSGEWQKPFSWHPFLMTVGMVSMMGVGAMTKKLGGYTNTKLHAVISWIGVFMMLGGLYAIYTNKENYGRPHLQSWHSITGAFAAVSSLGLGLVGSVVLHPDFGVDKTNKTIRFAHKTGARMTLFMAWAAAFSGLYKMTQDISILVLYAAPLVVFVPFVLM